MKKCNIMMEPINEVIYELDNSRGTILLMGEPGAGKTTILNEYLKRNTGNLIVEATIKTGEYANIWDSNIFNLYHTALIIRKILLYIEKEFQVISIHFMCFKVYIENILEQISFMQLVNNYDNNSLFIDRELFARPEILIDNLLGLVSKYLSFDKFVLILDDFDKVGSSSKRYQELIYGRIREYLNLILTISDSKVICDASLDFKNEKVIKLDYSRNIEVVKEILDREVVKIMLSSGIDFNYRIRFVLSDEAIKQIIDKTNGNLFDMLKGVRALYKKITELSKEQYEEFILNYIDREINQDAIVNGIIVPKRTFHLVQK